MKLLYLVVVWVFVVNTTAGAQVKETAQLATLSPILLIASDSELESYKKLHYSISTITYLGSYLITDSIWKSAAISLLLGASKELIHDGLFKKGEPLFKDMAWNSLGVAQGVVFTVSLKF